MSGQYHTRPGTHTQAPADFQLRLTDVVTVARPVGQGYSVVDVPASKLLPAVAKIAFVAPTSGVRQQETATAAIGGSTATAGTTTVTVTSALLATPRVVTVTFAGTENAVAVGGVIRAALAADAVVSANFAVSGSGTAIILTALRAAANDSTLNTAIAAGSGVSAAATSSNTTAGVLGTLGDFLGQQIITHPSPGVEQAAAATVAFSGSNTALLTSGAIVVNVTGPLITNGEVQVNLAAGQSTAQVATAIAAALNADTLLSENYTATASSAVVTLTAKVATTDATLNVAIPAFDVITAAPTSTNTAGVYGYADAHVYSYVDNVANTWATLV